jgi:hypothetical protein
MPASGSSAFLLVAPALYPHKTMIAPLLEGSIVNGTMMDAGTRNVGLKMNQTIWAVIDTPADEYPLLTSDRPVIRGNGMSRKRPPHYPYWATEDVLRPQDQAALAVIRGVKPGQIVREPNRQVCDYAAKYVHERGKGGFQALDDRA